MGYRLSLNPFCGGYSFLSSEDALEYFNEDFVLILFVVDIPF